MDDIKADLDEMLFGEEEGTQDGGLGNNSEKKKTFYREGGQAQGALGIPRQKLRTRSEDRKP